MSNPLSDPRTYGEPSEELSSQLEYLLTTRKHGSYRLSPFTCSVAISADGKRYAAVGVKLHGDSTHRKGRWTRCAIAASCPIEEGVVGLVPKLRKLYQDYCRNRHHKVNRFYPRRVRRAMAGK